jgi:cardiolipin-specific phospholipase
MTDPHGPRKWHSNLVQLSGKGRAINEFSVERVDEEVDENLVMLHGYGAGLGFYYKNFEGLSQVPGWKVWALDMLGMGRSTRPAWKIHAKDHEGKIREAEGWFVDALEEWRVAKKIDKFTLLGHSLGGYMAVAYALKYPGHLKKLILASPVGIPEDPYAVNAEMPEPNESTLANEFTQDQEDDIINKSNPNLPGSSTRQTGLMNANSNPTGKGTGDKNNFLGKGPKATSDNESSGTTTPTQAPTAPRRPLPKWLTYLWDANISPFSIVRWSGPLGPRFVSGWTSRRFSHLPAEESQALHIYSYTLFKQRGSGEYALAYILAPGAFARSPLIRRIQGVGRQTIAPVPGSASSPGSATSLKETASVKPEEAVISKRETGYPVIMMYGEKDWMDVAGGFAAEEKLKQAKKEFLRSATEEEKRKENGDAKVVIIKNAGHHVYLDGWEEFNDIMRKEMAGTSKDSKKLGLESKI